MTRDRLNPYIVLGIPYASSIQEVHRAFAKRARAIRNDEFDSYTVEDLTWAKHQIEQAEREPELDLSMYRVPASSEAFRTDSNSLDIGFFNPPIKKIERNSDLPSRDECNGFLFSALSGLFREIIQDEKIHLVHPFDLIASQ